MADSEITPSASYPQPVFEYTVKQRAALQVLSDAVAHLANGPQKPDAADIDAAWTLWGFREVIALDGMKLPPTAPQKAHPGPLSIVWRNPQKVGA